MNSSRFFVRVTGATLFTVGIAACGSRLDAASATATPVPAADASPPSPAEVAAIERAAKYVVDPALKASLPRGEAPTVATARDGDPSGAALADTRLIPSTCAEHDDELAAKLKTMRDEMSAEFKRWHDAQPDCWAEDRRRDAERREQEACRASASCFMLGGIGEGGGGMGSGIGLGSIGTIGHGSGTGVGMAAMHSETNNQIAGVDEADIVKTDGQYVYMAVNGALRIVEALNPRIVSVTKMPGVVRDMVIEGDRAVVFSASAEGTPRCKYAYDCVVGGDGTSTMISVLDISDRHAPKSIRRIDLSGSLMESRRIGTTIHTVVADGDSLRPEYLTWPDDLQICGTTEAKVRAKFAELRAKNERIIRRSGTLPHLVDHGVTTPLCAGLLHSKFDEVHTFTSLLSFDMADPASPIKTATVRGRPGTVFASQDALYIAAQRLKRSIPRGAWYSAYPTVDELTEVHKFAIGADPSDTKYIGSGVVPGHVLNQFAMDEWHNYLRIATSTGRVPSPMVESSISMLTEGEGQGGNLVRVGAVEHIGRGEDIRAVRFDEDRGYIVTFKKTDPLFVVDLFDAAHPQILGELKIPGFSTYLHRIDPTHLLSIGFDANDHGSFAYFDGLLLQLFDVTNPVEPKLLQREKIGTRGSSSAAATDHLAFNYFAETKVLAIPTTVCAGGGDGVNGNQVAFSGLSLYHVDLDNGFKHLGDVDHGHHGASCDTWWSQATSVVQRSVFLDDLVYSMALDRVKVQRMSDLGRDVADISLRP